MINVGVALFDGQMCRVMSYDELASSKLGSTNMIFLGDCIEYDMVM